jgi:hypothetical protein
MNPHTRLQTSLSERKTFENFLQTRANDKATSGLLKKNKEKKKRTTKKNLPYINPCSKYTSLRINFSTFKSSTSI